MKPVLFRLGSLLSAMLLGSLATVLVCTQVGLVDLYSWELAFNSEELNRTDLLIKRQLAVFRCNQVKTQIITELVNGHITLREAATEFARIHEETYPPDEPWAINYHLNDSEEELCQNVIEWAATEVSESPNEEEMISRLEVEFNQMFPDADPLDLPTHHENHLGSCGKEP